MTTTNTKKPNIIIYPSVDQLYESNIGIFEPRQVTLPTVIFKGSRLLLSFNGSYEQLKSQLYEATVRAVWESRLKEDIGEQAKGPVQEKDIPLWFKEGAIRYFAHQWTIEAEDALQRSWWENRFASWEHVINYQPRLAGHAFCYFLSEKYYPLSVTSIFQQLRTKNLVRATRLITKKPLDSLLNQCFLFYGERFADTVNDNIDSIAKQIIMPRKKGIIREVLLSPDQKQIAYISSRNNNRTIYIHDIAGHRTKKTASYKLVPWVNDHNSNRYPLIQWNKNDLFVTMPVKGKILTKRYNPYGNELDQFEIAGIDGVNDCEVLANGSFLLSAYKRGQSDIVAYDAYKEKYTPYTSDSYDDGAFARDKKAELYFISDRSSEAGKDTIVKQGIYTRRDTIIASFVADTGSYIKWDKPEMISGNRLLATHTLYGTERFAVFNSLQSNAFTTLHKYQPYQYLTETDEVATYKTDKDSIRISRQSFSQWAEINTPADTASPWLNDHRRHAAAQAKEDSVLKAAKNDEPSFLDNVLKPGNSKELAEKREDSIAQSLMYHPPKIKPYILQLHSAYFTGKVNNDYFINRYQPYQSYLGQFKFPELGGMAQGGFTDLFEHHHINIAYRLPASGEGSDFYVRYENTAKKTDWGIAYSRKVENLKPEQGRDWKDEKGNPYPQLAKVKTHYAEVSLEYPITHDLSAGFLQALRYDRTIFQATNRYSLNFEDLKSLWFISTVSITLNKLYPTVPALYRGFQAKGLVDVFKGFSQSENLVLGSGIQMSYHQPLYRYITLVVQAQTGHSGGQGKVLYNIGGQDNNVVPKTDTSVHFSQDAPYAFQTLITPFRGHLQNTLYGNQYALLNSDIVVPLFQTVIPIETPLQFINLLRPGVFTDIATAKETWNPAANDKGWLWSYGASMRSNLAGYTVRIDVAWPGSFNKKPVWYFSLKI